MTRSVLHVLACGAATSLQDGGRSGYQRYGLSASGPMDRLALAAANALAGNPPDAPAIELGLGSARLRVEGDPIRLALAGASSAMTLDGASIADHASFVLREGSLLAIERPRRGMYAYLALAGTLAVPPAMGSLSLHLRAGLGGLGGRALREGDRLPVEPRPPSAEGERQIAPLDLEPGRPIRVVLGPQDGAFPDRAIEILTGETFTVSHRADRMGYQLDGPVIPHGEHGFNIVSDGTVSGSIQVPGNGHPIVLMADRQTTGGYPKIATVVSADLRRIAQRRPGDTIRFSAVSVAQAVAIARERAAASAALPGLLQPALSSVERLLGANVAGSVVDALRDEP